MNAHYTLNAGQTYLLPSGTTSLPVWADDKSRPDVISHVQNSLSLSQKMDVLADAYLMDCSIEDLTFYLILKAKTTSLAYVLNEISELQTTAATTSGVTYSDSEIDTFTLGVSEAKRLSSHLLDTVALHGEKFFSIQDAPGVIQDFSSMNQYIHNIHERQMFSFTGS